MIGYYARVSTEEQAKKGSSIEDQLRRSKIYLTEYTEKHNKDVNALPEKEYIDRGVSGELINRPALNELRYDAINKKLSTVICLDPDRLSRKLMHQLYLTEELENQGIELLFVNGEYQNSPEGNLFYSLRGAVSEFEKAKIFERMRRGRLSKARQGKILRDYNIYGYNYNSETRQLEINESEAPVVAKIFSMFLEPSKNIQGINGIANYLTERKIPTKTGKTKWHRQVVKQILQNPTYVGVFYHNKWQIETAKENLMFQDQRIRKPQLRDTDQWISIKCPAIIDAQTFNKAQELLDNARRKWSKANNRNYLLSGLLVCGKCGNTLTGRRIKNWGDYEFIYTDKKSGSNKYRGCGLNIKCEELDKIIMDWVLTELHSDQNVMEYLALSLENNALTLEQELEYSQREQRKITRQRESIINLLGKRLLTEAETEKYLVDLNSKDQKYSIEQRNIQMKIDTIKQVKRNMTELTEKVKKTIYYWNYSGNVDESKELLRVIIKEIIIYPDAVKIVTF